MVITLLWLSLFYGYTSALHAGDRGRILAGEPFSYISTLYLVFTHSLALFLEITGDYNDPM